MAKIIRHHSYKFFAAVLVFSMFGFYFSLIDQSTAAQVTERSDIMNNSASSATSNHAIQFTLKNSLETTGWNNSTGATASDTLSITFDGDFSMGTIDCGDVDLAFVNPISASSIAGYNVDRNTNTYCVSSATSWGLSISGNVLTFHTPTSVQTYVATDTIMYVRVGTNAIVQDTGSEWITNPIQASAGSQDITIAGTFEGTGTIKVFTISGVEVSATVAETLSFTITGLPGHSGVVGGTTMGACINDTTSGTDDEDSETALNMVTTTATTVPFGTLSIGVNTTKQGCQRLAIVTNAGNGYTITTRENGALRSGLLTIPDTGCDAGGCSPSSAGTFTAGGGATGFGISCAHTTSVTCSTLEPNWGNGNNWTPIANISASSTQTPAKFSGITVATSAEVLAKVKYRIKAPASQGAGTYTNIVSFIATPVF